MEKMWPWLYRGLIRRAVQGWRVACGILPGVCSQTARASGSPRVRARNVQRTVRL